MLPLFKSSSLFLFIFKKQPPTLFEKTEANSDNITFSNLLIFEYRIKKIEAQSASAAAKSAAECDCALHIVAIGRLTKQHQHQKLF